MHHNFIFYIELVILVMIAIAIVDLKGCIGHSKDIKEELENLFVSGSWFFNEQLVRRLLKKGVDINYKYEDGTSVFLKCVLYGPDELDCIKVLVEEGNADISCKNIHGCGVLYFTSLSRNGKGFEYFLKLNINLENEDLNSYFDNAVSFMKNTKVLDILIERGVDINHRNYDGSTPLIAAARFNRNSKVIEKLIELGADISARDNEGLDFIDHMKKNIWLRFSRVYRKYKNK